MRVEKPTKEEVEECMKWVDDAFMFQALRASPNGIPAVPAVVKTLRWLENEFGIEGR